MGSSSYGTSANYGSTTSTASQEEQAPTCVTHGRDIHGAGTGSGLGSRSESGVGTGARRSTLSHPSVHIVVDDEDNNDDCESISSRSSYSTCSSLADPLQSCSRKFEGAYEEDDGGEISPRQLFWTYVALTPILLFILVLFAGLLQLFPFPDDDGIIVHWDRFGTGMLGWMTAFAFRTPIFSFFLRILHLGPYLCEWSTLLSAAFLEETVRLGLILFFDIRTDFGAIYWMGLGWAGMETAYYIGQSFVYSRWLSSEDDYCYRAVSTTTVTSSDAFANSPCVPAATAAAAAASSPTIRVSGMNYDAVTGSRASGDNGPRDLGEHQKDKDKNSALEEGDIVSTHVARHLLGIDRPWWSLMGRTSSMMVHIGLCCWLGHLGWRLLLPAAMVHGALYVIWGMFLPEKWSVPATSYGTLMTSMAVFLIGLAFYGEIV